MSRHRRQQRKRANTAVWSRRLDEAEAKRLMDPILEDEVFDGFTCSDVDVAIARDRALETADALFAVFGFRRVE